MKYAKRATSKDVAELAKVSRTTVSFVLNQVEGVSIPEETRQRVLDAARRLSYHPDAAGRRLATGKTHVIGLVVSQSPDRVAVDAFLPQVMHRLHQAAQQQRYHILFHAQEPGQDQFYAHLIRERHVDGIVLSGPRTDDAELVKLHREGVPIMLMGQLPQSDIPFIDADNAGGAQAAMEHLLDLGHTRIGIITNAPLTYTASRDRLAGYKAALQGRGIKLDKRLVRTGDFTEASGEAAMNNLLKLSPHPTAVFVASDVVALGALRAIKAHGLHVPEDISLVGFDDVPAATCVEPPLTTVRLPAYGIGWGAAERLIRLIAGEELDQPGVLLETELIVRGSTLKISSAY
jgi:LacI family transcriptional regulator, galactose operon repressor